MVSRFGATLKHKHPKTPQKCYNTTHMQRLQFYNTRTRSIEPFTSRTPKEVLLYTCGPTVYDYLTVGNWAAYVYWDVLVRALQANEYTVHRVMNMTDVGHLVSDADEGEDKLEKGARREGKTAWDVADFYGKSFIDGMRQLNMLAPEHLVKATEYIPQQLELVRALKEKGYTYQIDDGIYYDTSKFPTYADFAHLDLAAQKAGARVDYNTEKRNPSDFALWKFTPVGETRDMQWPTPIDLLDGGASDVERMGFPGWHLECSAMAMDLLGDSLDIHTGGIDHIPVHHTNEIAQSEAVTGMQFSNVWLHCNHLKVDGTKISKSLGNGYTLDDLTARGYTAQDLRVFILQSTYQSEGNFTFENLEAAHNRLHNWRRAAALRHQNHRTLIPRDIETKPSYVASSRLLDTLNDNLSTPEALAVVDQTLGEVIDTQLNHIDTQALTEFLEQVDSLLGTTLRADTPDITDEQKQRLMERTHAREAKEWSLSDTIRDELQAQGIVVRDTARGAAWEPADAHTA